MSNDIEYNIDYAKLNAYQLKQIKNIYTFKSSFIRVSKVTLYKMKYEIIEYFILCMASGILMGITGQNLFIIISLVASIIWLILYYKKTDTIQCICKEIRNRSILKILGENTNE